MSNKIDLSPAILDLVLYAGDGEDFQIEFKDDSGALIDVSYLTWNAQIRKTRTSDTAAELEIETTAAASGVITIHISADITRTLAKTGQWDLQCTSSSRSEPLTILQGAVTCNQDVTREVVVP